MHTGFSDILMNAPFHFIAMAAEDYFEIRADVVQLWPFMAVTVLYKAAFMYSASYVDELSDRQSDALHSEKMLSIYQRNKDFFGTQGHLVLSISVKPEKCEVEVQIQRLSDELLSITGRKSKI